MALQEFGIKKFGEKATTAAAEKPKAQFWLNIGYQTTVIEDKEEVTKFISLPVGIPLDTMELREVKGSNADYRALLSAQNDLLEQLKAHAAKLEPGDETIIGEGALVIQLRRVKAEDVAIPADANKYGKVLTF